MAKKKQWRMMGPGENPDPYSLRFPGDDGRATHNRLVEMITTGDFAGQDASVVIRQAIDELYERRRLRVVSPGVRLVPGPNAKPLRRTGT